MNPKTYLAIAFIPTLVIVTSCNSQHRSGPPNATAVDTFLDLLQPGARASLQEIENQWHPGAAVMLVETYRFCRSQEIRQRILEVLAKRTSQSFGADMNRWYDWIWQQEYRPHPDYATFKKLLYSRVDPRFAEYFETTKNAKIRLDEIRWGGVRRDGIPPLKNPKMIAAKDADWLADSNIVFGVVINGDARCYPKRILAWHEMFKDTIGGQSVCGVY